MRARTLVIAAAAALLCAFGAACLTTSGLSGGTGSACKSDLQSDVANCGQCGHACLPGQNATATCVAGQCNSTCNPGSLDCNQDLSDGCEATVASDPKNCGACGHDCLGGACNASVCQPIAIQSLAGQPGGVAVDDSGVYFGLNPLGGSTSEVVRVAKDGSGAQPLIVNRSNVSAVAIDDTFVYWIEVNGAVNGRILKAPKDGSSSVPQTVATGLAVTASAQLVIQSPNAIWSAFGVDDGSGTGTLVGGGVYSCALTGCGATPQVIGSFEGVSGVAVSPPSVFFGRDGGTFDCPLTGCLAAPVQVPGATAAAVQLASDSAAITWTTSTEVVRYAVSGNTVTTLATGLTDLHAVVTDATNVYFTSVSGGSVYSCALAGCGATPTMMASGLASPAYLAEDATAIYVSSGSGTSGSISRIAK